MTSWKVLLSGNSVIQRFYHHSSPFSFELDVQIRNTTTGNCNIVCDPRTKRASLCKKKNHKVYRIVAQNHMCLCVDVGLQMTNIESEISKNMRKDILAK